MMSDVSEEDLNTICRLKINIVRKLCESIRFWLSKGVKGKESALLVVMVLANLINYLISHKNLKYHLFSNQLKTQDYNENNFLIYCFY